MANLALISSSFHVPAGSLSRRRWVPRRTAVSCQLRNATSSKHVIEKFAMRCFATLSSSTGLKRMLKLQVCSVSPILWIGVGVGIGLSALFSVVATYLKRQAIRRAFKIVMGPDAPQNGQFNTAPFSPGSPFPFPSAAPVASQSSVKVENPATNVEALPPTDVTNITEEAKEAMSYDEPQNGHAFEVVMGPDAPQNGQFSTASSSPGSSFPFPAATPVASEPSVKLEDPATNVEALPSTDVTNISEESKEAMSHESDTPLSNQIPLASEPVASKPSVTVDAPTIKIEASPPSNADITQVEDSTPTTVKDYLN